MLLYEYEPGSALAHHLESRDLAEQLSWTSRLEIVKGLLASVYYLHYHDPTAPCYHRDIKPSKIVVTSSGKAKLMDCGLAKLKTWQSFLKGGLNYGTPGFVCPKYFRTGIFDEKSETYSVGITLLQLLGLQMCVKAVVWLPLAMPPPFRLLCLVLSNM